MEGDPGGAIGRATVRFVDEAAALPGERWTQRPARGGWSAAEVTEHVTIADRNLLRRLEHLQPLDGPTGVDDDLIPYLFYRGDEPPDVASPSGTWTDQPAALDRLTAAAAALQAWADEDHGDPRAVGAPHPAFGLLDAHQWLLFAGAHTLRHHAQLLSLR